MVELLFRRGIRDRRVLAAMATVSREAFLPSELREFAYEDSPLPIGEGQTVSQPYIVALMAQAAEIEPGARVLEVGTGSGYAAAVLAHVAGEVFTVERHARLAEGARERLRRQGLHDVHVLHGDGTLGWPEHAPYDAILVAAGGPSPPPALLGQLGPGGRLVIPVGRELRDQRLVRLKKVDGRFREEDLGPVRFVPLVGEGGWRTDTGSPAGPTDAGAVQLLREVVEAFGSVGTWDPGSMEDRIGDARVILLGEATHGTSEFYRMRSRITRELVDRHGVRIVAVEGDWPDAARVHRWIRGEPAPASDGGWIPFSRFPTWMWRNRETLEMVAWLRAWNERRATGDRVGFYGLDLYSLHRSIHVVLAYLDEVDPEAGRVARARYGCLTPWERDPAAYGRAAASGPFRACEDEVVAVLKDLLERQVEHSASDGDALFDAVLNARLITDAERYYRIMYRGGHLSWNLRDGHMFDTLLELLDREGPSARAVVWAHNSHVGDAAATEMGAQGQATLGGLARTWYGSGAFLVGFGTDHGTVAAAREWGGPMERATVRPAWPGSYEALGHATDVPAFLLHLRDPVRPEVRDELGRPRLERAIGVVYRPETELRSHYFQATLPDHFDSWIWFDETRAVEPLPAPAETGEPDGALPGT